MRKRRRRIKRKTKGKNKNRRKRNWWIKRYDVPVTHKYTRLTTELIILLELLWIAIEVSWFVIDVFIKR